MNTLQELEKVLKNLVAVRATHKEELRKLKAQKETYSADYLEKKRKGLVSEYRAQVQAGYEKTGALLRQLESNLQELEQQPLNLENGELMTALKIIELAGSELSFDSMRKINSRFQGKQPELKVLKAVYDSRGLNNSGIEELLIPEVVSMEKLQELNYHTFYNEGFVNDFARAINKFAQLAGEQFNTTIDSNSFEFAVRAGAGLPEPEEKS